MKNESMKRGSPANVVPSDRGCVKRGKELLASMPSLAAWPDAVAALPQQVRSGRFCAHNL